MKPTLNNQEQPMTNKAGALHTVAGAEGQRRSPRVYTHAVVAEHDHAARLAHYTRNARGMAVDQFDWMTRIDRTPLNTPFEPGTKSASWFICKAEDKAKAAEFFAKHGRNKSAYVEQQVATAEQE